MRGGGTYTPPPPPPSARAPEDRSRELSAGGKKANVRAPGSLSEKCGHDRAGALFCGGSRRHQLLFDDLAQGAVPDRPAQEVTVDEKAGCPGQSKTLCLGEVLLHGDGLLACVQTLIEARGVELQHARILFELRNLESLVVFEQRVVKLPEPALLASAPGCLGGLLSLALHREREVLEGHGHLAGEFFQESFEVRMDSLAIGAFVVREFDHEDGSVSWAARRRVSELYLDRGRGQSDTHVCLAT